MTCLDRSYPGQLDLCWPDSLNIRRFQLGSVPASCRCRWSLRLITWQHWARCPELYAQIGRIRLCLLLPAGLLPQWAPRISWAAFLA